MVVYSLTFVKQAMIYSFYLIIYHYTSNSSQNSMFPYAVTSNNFSILGHINNILFQVRVLVNLD